MNCNTCGAQLMQGTYRFCSACGAALSNAPPGASLPLAAPADDSPAGAQRAVATLTAEQVRTWATFCHLSALSGFVIPFGTVIGPLVVWLAKKDESPLVDDQGKESLNFQISMMIYVVISLILSFVLVGFLLLFVLMVVELVFVIMAAIAANNGTAYRYPLTIRFIK